MQRYSDDFFLTWAQSEKAKIAEKRASKQGLAQIQHWTVGATLSFVTSYKKFSEGFY